MDTTQPTPDSECRSICFRPCLGQRQYKFHVFELLIKLLTQAHFNFFPTEVWCFHRVSLLNKLINLETCQKYWVFVMFLRQGTFLCIYYIYSLFYVLSMLVTPSYLNSNIGWRLRSLSIVFISTHTRTHTHKRVCRLSCNQKLRTNHCVSQNTQHTYMFKTYKTCSCSCVCVWCGVCVSTYSYSHTHTLSLWYIHSGNNRRIWLCALATKKFMERSSTITLHWVLMERWGGRAPCW